MKYTAEEVREWAAFAQAQGKLYAPMKGAHEPWEKLEAMLTAYADLLERIKADEGAVPTFSRSDVSKWRGDAFENAAQIVDRYAEHFPEVTGAADDIRALIAHPPAQAAQVDANAALVEAMKLPDGYEVVEHLPGIWGYEYNRDDGERMASSASWNHPALAAIGAWRDHVEALAESAEPVAPAQAAQSVDVEKVREVIAGLRDYDDSAFNVLADKLEAALPESKP